MRTATIDTLARVAADITRRLDQIETRLTTVHPRAARDIPLAAMLDDIRDTAACLADPDSGVYGPQPSTRTCGPHAVDTRVTADHLQNLNTEQEH